MTVTDLPEHVFLVAFAVHGTDRAAAEYALRDVLPQVAETPILDSWWVAEDDRRDRSDCHSAIFTPPQAPEVAHLLAEHDQWRAHRTNLSEYDGVGVADLPDGMDPVSSGDWHDSDDAGIELFNRFADTLRNIVQPSATFVPMGAQVAETLDRLPSEVCDLIRAALADAMDYRVGDGSDEPIDRAYGTAYEDLLDAIGGEPNYPVVTIPEED